MFWKWKSLRLFYVYNGLHCKLRWAFFRTCESECNHHSDLEIR